MVTTISLVYGQRFLLAGVLLLSVTAKLIASPAEIGQTGIWVLAQRLRQIYPRAPMMSERSAWTGIAVVEGGLAAILIIGWLPRVGGGATAVLAAAFLVYSSWLLRHDRSASCGCFGARTPVTWKTVWRASVIGLIACGYCVATYANWDGHTSWSIALVVLGAEVAVLAGLSDELRPSLRRFKLACQRLGGWLGAVTTDIEAVRRDIERHEFWRDVVAPTFDPVFVSGWRAKRWYVAEYASMWYEEDVVIVASEYVGAQPPWMRIVVLREGAPNRIEMLGSWDSAVARARASRRQQGSAASPQTAVVS
jgi:hypothetical protein